MGSWDAIFTCCNPARMAGPLRIELPGALYHLTARGDAREDIYLDNEGRKLFLGANGHSRFPARWLTDGCGFFRPEQASP